MVSGVKPELTPVGVSLDGHVIYGPFKNTDKMWKKQHLDHCNGVKVNGSYGYALPAFSPYSLMCWGPPEE